MNERKCSTMPYIMQSDREIFGHEIARLNACNLSEGELNYVITKLLLNFVERKGKSYESLNAIEGILSCVSKEFYRRVTVPYEQEKCRVNGEVFE